MTPVISVLAGAAAAGCEQTRPTTIRTLKQEHQRFCKIYDLLKYTLCIQV